MGNFVHGYYLIDVEETGSGGSAPDLPEDFAFVEIGSPDFDRGWSLYECWGVHDADELPLSCQAVPERLRVLIESAKHFPPALALAREDCQRRALRTKDDFIEHLAASLDRRLREQAATPYFMARAKEACALGGLGIGQYAWIIAHDRDKRRLRWVTYGDYFAYDDPVEMFDATEEQLLRLPTRNCRPRG